MLWQHTTQTDERLTIRWKGYVKVSSMSLGNLAVNCRGSVSAVSEIAQLVADKGDDLEKSVAGGIL